MKKQKQIIYQKKQEEEKLTNGQTSDLRTAYQDGRCVFCGGHECNDENPCKWRKGLLAGKNDEETVNLALMHVQDIMDRIGIPYILLGDVVKGITKNNSLVDVNSIEVGIEQRYLIPEVISSLKTLMGDIKTENGYGYVFDKIPVDIKIIKRRYRFFEHPDVVIYRRQDYRIPNPIDDYLKARWIIR
jgi:hypothetical protein